MASEGFETISTPKGSKSIDELAEKVFMESIKVAGGLKKLIEYRNLTWLSSLAEAAYVVVLKNEALKTNKQISEILGITENTVRNILSADEVKAKEFLEGKIEEFNEHKAGAIAKLAYKNIKNAI